MWAKATSPSISTQVRQAHAYRGVPATGCIEPWFRYSAACLPDQWIIAAGLIMQQVYIDRL